jgi:hypothetical protein
MVTGDVQKRTDYCNTRKPHFLYPRFYFFRLRAGTVSWYVPKPKIENEQFGALFRAHSAAQKWPFDFGTYSS